MDYAVALLILAQSLFLGLYMFREMRLKKEIRLLKKLINERFNNGKFL